jgi:hypothetical protein
MKNFEEDYTSNVPGRGFFDVNPKNAVRDSETSSE